MSSIAKKGAIAAARLPAQAVERAHFSRRPVDILLFAGLVLSTHESVIANRNIGAWHATLALMVLLISLSNRIVIPRSVLAIFGALIGHVALVSLMFEHVYQESFVQLAIVGAGVIVLFNYVLVRGPSRVAGTVERAAAFLSIACLMELFLHLFYPSLLPVLYDSGIFQRGAGLNQLILQTSGFLKEPSWVGVLITPALYISLTERHRGPMVLILLATLTSQSGLAFLSLLMVLIIYALLNLRARARVNLKHAAVALVLGVVVYSAFSSPAVQKRIDASADLYEVAGSRGVENLGGYVTGINGSVRNIFTYGAVAGLALHDSYWLGSGFGSFPALNKRYAPRLPWAAGQELLMGGGSLLVRLAGELGIFVAIFLWLLVWKARQFRLWIRVNRARAGREPLRGHAGRDVAALAGLALTVIIAFLVRKDAYFDLAFMLAIALLLACSRWMCMRTPAGAHR